ncbi:serine--tRNA ligase [Candidatus Pacearchaeota archaeon]|nr:serine--tRNA ligase [Candidatus Pacearchaeota archaeon]
MIDIKDLRENPEAYRKNTKKKGKDVLIIKEVLGIDEEWRKIKLKLDKLRSERNKISKKINEEKKSGGNVSLLLKKAKEIPDKIRKLGEKEKEVYGRLKEKLYDVPNLMHEKVPVGKDDSDNVVRKKVGKIPKFGFPVKNHVEIVERLGIADFDASAKTSGSGFYYLKGDLALLNRALINFTNDFMEKKGYSYIEPPLMVDKKVTKAKGDFEAFKNALYKIEGEDLYLIPTAEDAILGMLSGKTIIEEKLPLKFYGYSMCFRKEIGSHGINEKGFWRTHQFNKVEQFIFCHPKDSWGYYEELKKNSEEIMKKLGLPYRIVECCTGDLADWKARSEDIEVYRPTLKSYGEVISLSNCTDYQARDLNIRGLSKKGERYVLHTLNNTALATSRIMVAIIENYQQKDGTIKIPKVLIPYMNGKKVIGR